MRSNLHQSIQLNYYFKHCLKFLKEVSMVPQEFFSKETTHRHMPLFQNNHVFLTCMIVANSEMHSVSTGITSKILKCASPTAPSQALPRLLYSEVTWTNLIFSALDYHKQYSFNELVLPGVKGLFFPVPSASSASNEPIDFCFSLETRVKFTGTRNSCQFWMFFINQSDTWCLNSQRQWIV